MNRQKFLALIATALAMPLPPTRSGPTEPLGADLETDFVKKFNRWASFRKQGGLVDAREIRAWNETVKAWKKLAAIVKY